jgi:hypothetical protein
MAHIYSTLGDYTIRINYDKEWVRSWFCSNFRSIGSDRLQSSYSRLVDPDLIMDIECRAADETVHPDSDYSVDLTQEYHRARVTVNAAQGLAKAIMEVISAFVIYHQWGLLIRGSISLVKGQAHLDISKPETTTLVRIHNTGILAYESPLGNRWPTSGILQCYPLAGIYFSRPSEQSDSQLDRKSIALNEVFKASVYSSLNCAETAKWDRLCRLLCRFVPVSRQSFPEGLSS